MSQLLYAYQVVFTVALIILAVLVILCLFRAILGPSMADRIVAINIIGTLTIMMIGILAIYLKEGYLIDVCLVYAMLSFLAVIVLTKIHMSLYLRKKQREEERKEKSHV